MLRQLAEENVRLKRVIADLWLDKAMLQDVVSRKLRGLIGGASWSMTFAAPGRSASGGPALCCGRNDRATTIVARVPIRPTSRSGSGRSARHVCTMATDVSASKVSGRAPEGVMMAKDCGLPRCLSCGNNSRPARIQGHRQPCPTGLAPFPVTHQHMPRDGEEIGLAISIGLSALRAWRPTKTSWTGPSSCSLDTRRRKKSRKAGSRCPIGRRSAAIDRRKPSPLPATKRHDRVRLCANPLTDPRS